MWPRMSTILPRMLPRCWVDSTEIACPSTAMFHAIWRTFQRLVVNVCTHRVHIYGTGGPSVYRCHATMSCVHQNIGYINAVFLFLNTILNKLVQDKSMGVLSRKFETFLQNGSMWPFISVTPQTMWFIATVFITSMRLIAHNITIMCVRGGKRVDRAPLRSGKPVTHTLCRYLPLLTPHTHRYPSDTCCIPFLGFKIPP